MKICFSSTGIDLESELDLRFGRCYYFLIVNTETEEIKAIENEGGISAHGAGVSAAQQVAKEDVDVVVTGNIGPNAMKILEGSDIKIFRGEADTIKSNLEKYKENRIETINSAKSAHFGLGK